MTRPAAGGIYRAAGLLGPARAVLAATLLWALSALAVAEPGDLRVRVLVDQRRTSVRLEGVDLRVAAAPTSAVLSEVDGPGRVVVGAAGGGLRLDGLPVGPHLRVESPATWIVVDGRSLRGPIELHAAPEGVAVVDVLPMDDYLAGLVGAEMPAGWPAAALEAQAVAARSYALARVARSASAAWDLEGSVLDQVYGGPEKEDPRVRAAVLSTAGLVLEREGRVVEAFYHAACGGRTEDPSAVWEGRGTYPPPVSCTACADCPSRTWTARLDARDAARRLGPAGFVDPVVLGLRGTTRSPGRRWATVEVRGARQRLVLPGNELRRLLGFSVVRSLDFTARVDGQEIELTGVGLGHGVGMCQWGARGLAAAGWSRDQILAHYYPGSTLAHR